MTIKQYLKFFKLGSKMRIVYRRGKKFILGKILKDRILPSSPLLTSDEVAGCVILKQKFVQWNEFRCKCPYKKWKSFNNDICLAEKGQPPCIFWITGLDACPLYRSEK